MQLYSMELWIKLSANRIDVCMNMSALVAVFQYTNQILNQFVNHYFKPQGPSPSDKPAYIHQCAPIQIYPIAYNKDVQTDCI